MGDYTRTYEIRWSDIDANGHVNYAAYVDAAGDLRYHFFAEHGFPSTRFLEMGIGPVYTSLQAQFLREVLIGETVTISFAMRGLSPQGRRWHAYHEVRKENGKRVVVLDVEGLIVDFATRRSIAPSPELLEIFHLVPRATDFKEMTELLRS